MRTFLSEKLGKGSKKRGRQVDSLSVYPFSIGHYQQEEKDAATLAIG